MKMIYFVRHGESEGNVGPLRQLKTTPLTENGKQQAQFIADRATKLPIEIVVSSTMTRAKETADFIVEKIGRSIEYSDLFIEKRHPSEVYGKPKDNPESLQAEQSIAENFKVPGYRFSDEENFEDLKERAGEALTYLLQRPEEKIMVVTHGFFMRIIMARVFFGEKLTASECEQCIKKFHMENTGLTIIAHDKNDWWLWTWNDHAHLG